MGNGEEGQNGRYEVEQLDTETASAGGRGKRKN